MLGAAYLVVITSANTVFQSRAPRHLQARVSSLYSVMLGGGYALGLVLQGWLGDRFGLRAVPAAFAFCFFALALGLRVFRPTAYHSLEAGVTEPAPRRRAAPHPLFAAAAHPPLRIAMELERRLEELELRFTEQQETIQSLSDTIYAQQRQLDLLLSEIGLMKQKLPDPGLVDASQHEKPPHY